MKCSNDTGLWGGDALGGIDLIVRRGDEAIGQDIQFGYLAGIGASFHPATINNQGDVAFGNSLTGSGVGTSDNSLWTHNINGGLSLVAREDDAVPGLTGVAYSGFGSPVFNSSGDLAFLGSVKGSNVVFGSSTLQRKMKGQGIEVVVKGETNAPGTGTTFTHFWSARSLGYAFNTNPIMNQEGHLAFSGNLKDNAGTTGTNDTGIWSEGGNGVLRLVAREGDPAPGTALAFPEFQFWAVVLNGNGQTAFMGDISPSTTGLWAEDLQGNLELIAIEGGDIDVDDGPGIDLRTISQLDAFRYGNSGNEDGRPSGFNDLGQVVFRAAFTDGSSGIFVSNSVALPTAYGDFDADGDVDGADFLAWQRNDGTSAGLNAWQNNFGSVTSPISSATQIPEPTTLTMTTIAIYCLNGFRRKAACQNITVLAVRHVDAET